VSSVSNGLYFLTLTIVSVIRVFKRNIEKVWGLHYTLGARYLYIIRDAEKVCGARYTLGARYLPKNMVYIYIYTHIYTYIYIYTHAHTYRFLHML
jgi:hypothetical protein